MKTILVDAAGTFIIEGKGICAAMHELLDTYPNKKIIITNANDEQRVRYGLNHMPYEVFTLKHNPDKTDPNYFTRLLEHYKLTATNVIYFEHDADSVKSAQSVGIISFHYDKDKKDLIALKRFIDENISY